MSYCVAGVGLHVAFPLSLGFYFPELILNLDHKLHSQFFRPDPYLLLKLNLFQMQPLWKSVQSFPKIKTKKIKESNQATQPCTYLKGPASVTETGTSESIAAVTTTARNQN